MSTTQYETARAIRERKELGRIIVCVGHSKQMPRLAEIRELGARLEAQRRAREIDAIVNGSLN